MMEKKLESDILLDEIAKSMGGKVVVWNTVNETIERNISFAKIMDASKYMSEEESIRIEQRSFVGAD